MEKTNTGVITPDAEFLGQLRGRTAALHQHLEDLPLSKSLMSENVTLATYAWYLTCMKDVMAAYDEQILPIIEDQVPQAADRLKQEAIAADLNTLESDGVDLEESTTLKVPQIQDDAFAWGMAYVIEGSTLGGRVILKHITPKLGVTEERGARFFAGYGADTGMMWKSFLAALTAYAVDQNAGEQIIKGALAGFGMIANHFETNGMLE
jgi:heme oxygenase